MNKIYKVMYSKVKQCAVVVSEIAKSHGHNGESSSVRKHAALTAAVLIALGSFSFTTLPTVQATDSIFSNDYVGTNYKDDNGNSYAANVTKNYHGAGAQGVGSNTLGMNAIAGKNTVTIGDRNAFASQESVYIGSKYDANNQVHPSSGTAVVSVGYGSDAAGTGSIAIGSGAAADTFDNAGHGKNPDGSSKSIAIGYNANAKQNNIAIGANSIATAKASTEMAAFTGQAASKSYVSVGDGTEKSDTQYRRITNVADGAAESDAATVGQLQEAINSVGTVNAGWGIDVAKAENGGKTISLDRNLGNNSTSVTQVSNTGLILGGDFSGTDQPDEQPDEKYGNYGATGQYAVTLGGRSNRASGESSVAAGGMDNTADGNQAFVGGGSQNTASGRLSSAIGGAKNTASGLQSSAFGGSQNTASGQLSSAIGGDQNTASGQLSSAIGGDWNTASGSESSAIGGAKNIARGWQSSAFGGTDNISLDMLSSTLGGMNSVVLGYYATGIAGGSTGSNAWNALAAGSNSVVTVENGTAIGYQATTNEEGTIAFGHDKGDISGYTVTWKQKATSANGKYYDANGIEITKDQYEALRNPDYTFNDYSKDPTITENTHKTAAYNRLVKVHDGKNAHDAVVMEQLKPYTKSDASNIGSNLKTYTVGDDGETITETDATEEQQKDNKDAWGLALGAGTLSTADAAKNSDQLITGKTLYNYDKPTTNGTYVNQNQTTGQNLSALDTQVKANTDALTKPNHNIKYYSVTAGPSLGYDQYTNENNDGAKGTASLAAGNVTHTDGVASTVVGSYSAVFGTGLQGAAAVSYGTVNVNNNTDTTKAYSGVANSIVGQANMTTNSNAAIIYGAGNTVTDSYRDIDKDKAEAILNSTGNAEQLKNALQDAVPTSGAQVMVMGGGNSVDKAYMTQVTGVGNKVTGADSTYTEGTSTQYNFVDGFQNELTNGKHDYIIGSKNKVSGDSVDTNQSNIIFGDNHKLTNRQNNVIIGSSDTADDETTASDIVAIGHNAKVSAEGGVAIGSGSEATVEGNKVAGYDPATGAASTNTASATWQATNGAVSIGTADGNVTRQINGVAAGTKETDAVNVAQLKKLNGMKANVAADNIGSKLNGTDEEKTNNEKAWATAIGNGDIATPKGMLVTDTAVHNEVRPTKDGTYVKAANTTAANLTALDTQVGTNTTDITNLKDLKNITDNGKTVIKNLAKDTVKVEQGDRVTVTHTTDEKTGAITYKVSANNDGTVTKGDTNLVSGDTVNTAITNAIDNANTDTTAKLKNKADVDAGNIGTNLKGSDGKAASADDIKTNKEAWASAIGTGTVASGSNQLVTGSTVYNYNAPVAESGKKLNYVSAEKTTGQNLTALDTQVGTNTGDISNLKNLSNISSAGETVIKNLAKGSIGMEDGSHTTASHRDVNGVETYKVDVNVDGKVESGNKGIVDGGAVYSAIQDVKNQTSADLANKANVDASNLSYENVKSWQEKLGNGEVVSGNKGLVTGDTVFKAVDTKANRDGSNLTTDEADKFSEKIAVGKVEANDKRAVSGETVSKAISDLTGDMNTKLDGKANTSLDNITDTGKNVIRDLAKGSVKVIDGTNTTVTTVEGKGETPTTYAVKVEGKGTVTSGNTGLISGGTAYTELRPADGTYVKRSSTTAANLSALDTGLKNTSSLIHTNTSGDTIHIGETSKASKVDVSSTDANGNKNGRVVTGVVTDAKDANSAANVGYVNGVTAANTQQIYRDMNNAYGRLNNNINKAAAGSNALAALHPLDYDPDDKADFAVGYGHYRNANAAAVGAFYHPNENTMVNVGVSLGNGDPGFNAGVSFKIGSGSAGHQAMSKTEMAKVINSQSKEIDALKKDNADKDKRIDALEQKMAEILAKLDKNGK